MVGSHDLAAEGKLITPTVAGDATPSEFTAADALGTVVSNYAICEQYRTTPEALQAWINQTKANVAPENKKAK
jgi:hypothetical protein